MHNWWCCFTQYYFICEFSRFYCRDFESQEDEEARAFRIPKLAPCYFHGCRYNLISSWIFKNPLLLWSFMRSQKGQSCLPLYLTKSDTRTWAIWETRKLSFFKRLWRQGNNSYFYIPTLFQQNCDMLDLTVRNEQSVIGAC